MTENASPGGASGVSRREWVVVAGLTVLAGLLRLWRLGEPTGMTPYTGTDPLTTLVELAERYDPARHDPWLAQLGWELFSRDELHLIPTIVAVVPAALVAGDGLLSLSRLLLSGRPVQVLLLGHPAENPGAEEEDALSGYRFEPGYLGISHREAVVQQTTIARPLHMLEGFAKGLHAAHTALHVVAVADGTRGAAASADPWLFLTAALEGRAHPVFHYDPEAGET